MKIKLKLPNISLKKILSKIKEYKLYIYWGVCILSIFLLSYSIYEGISDYQTEQSGNRTLATITSLKYQNDSYIGTITYTVNNQSYQKTMTIKEKDVSVNDKIEIKYKKNNPNIIVKNNHTIEIIFFLPISLICLKISFYYLYDYYKDKKHKTNLKTKGLLIYADLNQVFINNKAKKKKGKYPYRIRLKYQDVTNNQLYTFESKDIYFPIETILIEKGVKRLPIYINKENQKDYYVDIEFLLPE